MAPCCQNYVTPTMIKKGQMEIGDRIQFEEDVLVSGPAASEAPSAAEEPAAEVAAPAEAAEPAAAPAEAAEPAAAPRKVKRVVRKAASTPANSSEE